MFDFQKSIWHFKSDNVCKEIFESMLPEFVRISMGAKGLINWVCQKVYQP